MATTAQAASTPHTLFKGGYWETFGIANNNDGQSMCGMQANFNNVGRLYVKWTSQNGMWLQVWKPSWRVAKGIDVPFQLEFFDDAKPGDSYTITAAAGLAVPSEGGLGSSVNMTVKKQDRADLLKVFGDADMLTVNFPQGDEPQWSTKMDGSRKAANEFMRCIYIVQQAARASTQPVTRQPTQPIGKAPIKQVDDGGI
jgi:hypothetical protein